MGNGNICFVILFDFVLAPAPHSLYSISIHSIAYSLVILFLENDSCLLLTCLQISNGKRCVKSWYYTSSYTVHPFLGCSEKDDVCGISPLGVISAWTSALCLESKYSIWRGSFKMNIHCYQTVGTVIFVMVLPNAIAFNIIRHDRTYITPSYTSINPQYFGYLLSMYETTDATMGWVNWVYISFYRSHMPIVYNVSYDLLYCGEVDLH